MNDTRGKILKKALHLFNTTGIEYVGMRELAAALGIRVGNITYYFATKDELVFQLSEQYSATNSVIHAQFPVKNLSDFLEKQQLIFKNMITYRCLLLSMVHLMDQNPMIAASYEKVSSARRAGLKRTFKTLHENKSLNLVSSEDQWTLVSLNSLLGRFWLSEAGLSGKKQNHFRQMKVYLNLLCNFLKPYATKSGLKEIAIFQDKL